MKHTYYIFLFYLMTTGTLVGQETFRVGDNLSIEFERMHIDLGKVEHGDSKSSAFNFTNTGTEAIEIEIVDGCVCTTLDWPRKPILPGEKGSISLIFDSTEKEKSETVDIDVTLKNKDPETGNPIFIFLTYEFDLEF